MMFGFPAAFWFGLIALPVAAAFFYRRHAVERVVPALELWEAMGTPVSSKSFSSRFRRLFSLLMQLLLVALLILALADPSPAKPQAARTIIVLDVGATLQTRQGMEDRASAARREAQRVLDQIPADGEAAILRAAHTPILAQKLTANLAEARSAVQGTVSVDVDSDLPRAIEAARSLLDPQIRGEVVVISDFSGASPAALSQAWHDSARLRFIRVGEQVPDAAITGLWAEERGADRRIVARIAQHGMTGRAVSVQLKVNGQLIDSQSVTLAKEPVRIEFLRPMPSLATYEVIINSGDALAVDDRAMGVAPREILRSVCLVTAGNLPLQQALLADPTVSVRIVAPADYRGPQGAGVVIVDGPGLIGAEPGDASYLFLAGADPFGWYKDLGKVRAGAITHWSGDHPAMADIDPTLFKVSQATQALWKQGVNATPLMAADVLPLAVEAKPSAAGAAPSSNRYLYWLFDLSDTDLPRRLSFPLLLWNAIDYLATGGHDPAPDSALTGVPLHLDGPPDKAPSIVGPSGNSLTARATDDGWVISDTLRQGIYRNQNSGESFALNLLSDRGTLAAPDEEPPADASAAGAAPPAEAQSLFGRIRLKFSWRLLLAGAAAVGVLEWILFNRRIVRIG